MKKLMHENNRLWDYEILQQLGKGEYGQVYLVKSKKDGNQYALKKVNLSSAHEKEKIQAFRQIKALKMIRHPDIIEYYQSFLSIDHAYIIMEYAQKGDFLKVIRERKKRDKFYSENELWQIFRTLTSAVKYLHQKYIVHRDIKLQNIFLTKQDQVKIGDLGMAKILINPQDMQSTRVGTPVYFAPEIVQHQPYSFGVDIWALGCVFYYLATFQHPFKDATIQTLGYYIVDHQPKPIKGNYTPQIIGFISSLMEKNPNKRPNIYQVVNKIKSKDEQIISNKISVFNFNQLLLIKQSQNVSKKPQRKFKNNRNRNNVSQYYESLLNRYSQEGQSPQKIQSLSPERKRPLNQQMNNSKLWTQSMIMTKPNKMRSVSHSPMIKSNGFDCAKNSPKKGSGFIQNSNIFPDIGQFSPRKQASKVKYYKHNLLS